MELSVFEDDLTLDDVKHLTPRVGARAILKVKDQYCLIYNKHWNLYTLPGGGVEEGETYIEALKREVLEETGFTIKNIQKTVVLKEHFEDSIWHHHFFYCEADGNQKAPALTQEEIKAGMTTVFKPFEEVLECFLDHQTDHLHSSAIYNREFIGFMHSIPE
jgi:ADP-ribose pyrophosphatase YjhB (NUDIX family)